MAAEETWFRIALPLLRWVAANPDAKALLPAEFVDELGATLEEIDRELGRLWDAGYLAGRQTNAPDILRPRLTERGLRAVGVWPSEDDFDAMVNLLESLAATASSQEKRSRLIATRDALLGLGRDTGVNLFSAYVQTRVGL